MPAKEFDLRQLVVAAGQKVFDEGDQGDVAYIVASGLIEISITKDGEKVVLGHVHEDGVFGEMALIQNVPRMATALAKRNTTLIEVPRAVLDHQMKIADPFMQKLVHVLIFNVRSLSDRMIRHQLYGSKDDPEA
ncbi:MAG: cyclic nucleotide-binding domain-containing protein [Rhodospirillales bacterium]